MDSFVAFVSLSALLVLYCVVVFLLEWRLFSSGE
jgi:hypothetical protein